MKFIKLLDTEESPSALWINLDRVQYVRIFSDRVLRVHFGNDDFLVLDCDRAQPLIDALGNDRSDEYLNHRIERYFQGLSDEKQ